MPPKAAPLINTASYGLIPLITTFKSRAGPNVDVLIGGGVGGAAIKIYPSGRERLVQTPHFVFLRGVAPPSISEVKVAVALASIALALSKSHRPRIVY